MDLAKKAAASAGMASAFDGGGMPDKEEMKKQIEMLQNAQRAQSQANDLRDKAKQFSDPAQREKALQEAFEKEVEANGHAKMARRLQSGTWQGMGFGGGIGAGAGLGTGALIGTLLGGILAVPTTGLGMLIGAGTGAIHGPWVKLGGKELPFQDADAGEIVDELEKQRNGQQGGSAPAPYIPPGNRVGPKKIEIRSQKNQGAVEQGKVEGGSVTEGSVTGGNVSGQSKSANKRGPKKIEVRSGGKSNGASSKS